MAYRDPVRRCPFCDREHPEAPQPYAGLRICRACHDGKSTRALLARGIRVQTVEELAVDVEGHQHQEAHALGGTDHALPLQARFSREGFLGRRFKLDLQTGDALFDDSIGVEGRGLELERLLALEPVRFAVMDLVAEARLEIDDGRLRARALGCSVEELRRAATTIAWGMWVVAQETSCPAAAPILLPALEVLSGRRLIGLTLHGDRVDPRQLAALPELRYLTLARLELTSSDLAPFLGLGLEALRLIGIEELRDLGSIRGLGGLRTLVLVGCPVEDLSPVAGLTALRAINLRGTRVRDLSPLFELPALEELILSSTPTDEAQLEALRARHPAIQITR